MRDLKDTVEVERRCLEEKGPVFVTKNGYGKLVVMDINYYEEMMSKVYEAKAVNEGLADVEAEKIVSGDKVKDKLAKKYAL